MVLKFLFTFHRASEAEKKESILSFSSHALSNIERAQFGFLLTDVRPGIKIISEFNLCLQRQKGLQSNVLDLEIIPDVTSIIYVLTTEISVEKLSDWILFHFRIQRP